MAASFVSRVCIVGGSIYLIYKALVPSTLDMQKHMENSQNNVLSGGKESGFQRVMKMSADGYSYEAITKIIQAEEREKYKAIYERERLERIEALKELEQNNRKIMKIDEAVSCAVSFLRGKS